MRGCLKKTRDIRQHVNLRDRLPAKEGRPVDARGRNNGVLIPLSLRPEVISVHSQPVAARVGVRDLQYSLVHSVVNRTKEYAELVWMDAMAAESRGTLKETARTETIPEGLHQSLQSREVQGPQLAEAGDRVRQAAQHRAEGDPRLRDPSS